jgi:NADPH:quinone reductase-like Zn-dependent oxidoreductase
MKAAVFNRYGGNDVVELKKIPVPVPGPGEVVIKVHAASVNPVDWKVRYGQARILTGSKFPKVLGCECAGEVTATGARATKFRKGDRVVMYTSVRKLAPSPSMPARLKRRSTRSGREFHSRRPRASPSPGSPRSSR